VLKAIIAVESGINHNAGHKDEIERRTGKRPDKHHDYRGLTQVNYAYQEWFDVDNSYFWDGESDPAKGNTNVKVGARVLKNKYDHWKGQGITDPDELDVLGTASYNAGQGHIEKARDATQESDPGPRQDGYSKEGLKKAVGEDKACETWEYVSKLFGGDSYDGEVEYPGYLGDEEGQLDPRKHDPE